MSKTNVLPRDAFVSKVKEKPGQDNALVQVQGFVGDSTVQGYFRLYSDSSLNDFIDIPEDDVVHYEQLPADQSPLGGLIIWLSQDAVFAVGDAQAKNRPQQRFLEGSIAAQAKTDLVGYTPASVHYYCPTGGSGWHTCRSHFYTECMQSKFLMCRWTGGNTVLTDITVTKASAVDACPSALGCTTTYRERITDYTTRPVGRDYGRYADPGFGRFRP